MTPSTREAAHALLADEYASRLRRAREMAAKLGPLPEPMPRDPGEGMAAINAWLRATPGGNFVAPYVVYGIVPRKLT